MHVDCFYPSNHDEYIASNMSSPYNSEEEDKYYETPNPLFIDYMVTYKRDNARVFYPVSQTPILDQFPFCKAVYSFVLSAIQYACISSYGCKKCPDVFYKAGTKK